MTPPLAELRLTVGRDRSVPVMQIDKTLKQKLDLPTISQICIVVRHLAQAIAYYEDIIGLGPFVRPEITYTEKFYHGQPVGSEWVMGFCSLGSIEMELFQPVSGRTIHQDFLATHGEGLHHLGFDVQDMDERLARYAKMGISVLMSGRTSTGGFAYLDTASIGGVIFELIQRPARRA